MPKIKEKSAFDIKILREVGKAFCISVLDLVGLNPHSRIANSPFRNVETLREYVKIQELKGK